MRCPRCGRAYHKTTRGPNVPYSAREQQIIEELSALGFTARQIAMVLPIRSAENIRSKCRHMGWRLTPGKPGAPHGNRNARGRQ